MSDDLAGRTLGRYQVLERLGRGGMAEVYRAYQPSLDRYVAIKVIYPHLATDQALLDRFGREARAVAALHHPNIVQVHDFDVQSGTAFMAMEFVSGPTLKAAIHSLSRRGQLLPLPVVGQIVGQIGDALAYAHEQNVIHRDVKPANVLIRRRVRSDAPIDDAEIDELLLNLGPTSVVLTDFGVARIVKDSVEHTAAGTILGSPAYMSPEQGRGERVDARSDIYSLGIVLFELLTGQVPFDADTPFAIVLKHTTAPLPSPRGLRPNLPEGIERVLLKALAKEPADRFQDAAAFGAAVREQCGAHDYSTVRLVSAPVTPIPERLPPRETRVVETTRTDTPPSMPAASAVPAPPARPNRRSPLRMIIAIVIALVAIALVALIAFIAGGATVFRGLGQAGALVVPSPFSAEATAAAAEGTVIPFLNSSPAPTLSASVDAALENAAEACSAPGCPGGSASTALDILNAAIAEQPNSAELLSARAMLYVWWDPYTYSAEARADADAALAIDPRNAAAYLARGSLTEAIAEEDTARAQALEDYNRAIEIAPELIAARMARATFLSQAPDVYDPVSPSRDQIVADMSYVLEREPQNLAALNLRADVYYTGSLYEQSLADSNAALAIDANDFRSLMRRGRLYRYYLNQPEQALNDFGAAIKIDPSNVDARESHAALLVVNGDYQAAREDADVMIAAEPGNPAGYIFRGFVRLALEHPQEALEDFERALALGGPAVLDARYGRARTLLARNELEQALPDLEAAAADPETLSYVSDIFFAGHNRVFLDLAAAYIKLDQLDKAGPALDTAVERDGNWHVPYLARARYRILTGNPEGAREDLRNALTYAQTDAERDEVDRELRRLPTR